MNAITARALIAATFFVGAAISCVTILVAENVEAIDAAGRDRIVAKLIAVYAAPFAALLAGLFAKGRSGGRVKLLPFWVAMVLCGAWNSFLVWECLRFGAAALDPNASGGTQDLLNHFETASKGAAGAMAAVTYFFAKAD
jgi:hypothetical protein